MLIRYFIVGLLCSSLAPDTVVAYCCRAPTDIVKICQETAPSSPLNFGTFEQAVPASVASANYNPFTGNLILNNLTKISGGQTSSLGLMTICGRRAQLITVQWPTSVSLVSSGRSIVVHNITATNTSIGTISIILPGKATCLLSAFFNPGLCQLAIGGTASLQANQGGGLYLNTLTFSIK